MKVFLCFANKVLLPCHCSLIRWLGKLCKLGQNTACVPRWRLTPQRPATGELWFINIKLQQQLVGVDGDGVAFLDQSNRAAFRGLRGNVPDHHAPGGPGKAAIGDQAHALAKTSPDDG